MSERLIMFENHLNQSKDGKTLQNLDIFGYFYTPMVTKWLPIKGLECIFKGRRY